MLQERKVHSILNETIKLFFVESITMELNNRFMTRLPLRGSLYNKEEKYEYN